MTFAERYAEISSSVFGSSPAQEVESALKSELLGVSDEAWTLFVRLMATAKLGEVSESNALGMFELMPRRLADFGLVTNLKRSKSGKGRTIWVGAFVLPMTCERFLRSPRAQYKMFVRSMRNYDERMCGGEIVRDESMSRAGALALLHRAGPNALDTWRSGQRFSGTQELFDRVEGVF